MLPRAKNGDNRGGNFPTTVAPFSIKGISYEVPDCGRSDEMTVCRKPDERDVVSRWMQAVTSDRSHKAFYSFAGAIGTAIFIDGLTTAHYLDAAVGLTLVVWASFLIMPR